MSVPPGLRARAVVLVAVVATLVGCVYPLTGGGEPSRSPRPAAPDGWTREVGSAAFATPDDWLVPDHGELRAVGLTPENNNLVAAASPDGSCLATVWGIGSLEPPDPAEVPDYLVVHAGEDLAVEEPTPVDVAGHDDGLRRRLVGPTHDLVALSAWDPDDNASSWLLLACDDPTLVDDISVTWAP